MCVGECWLGFEICDGEGVERVWGCSLVVGMSRGVAVFQVIVELNQGVRRRLMRSR